MRKKIIFLSMFSLMPLLATLPILTSCSGSVTPTTPPPTNDLILGENFFTNEKDAKIFYNKLIYRIGENYNPNLENANTKIQDEMVRLYNSYVEPDGHFKNPITVDNIVSIGDLQMKRIDHAGKQNKEFKGLEEVNNVIYNIYEFSQLFDVDFYYESKVVIKSPDDGRKQEWPVQIEKQAIRTEIKILYGS